MLRQTRNARFVMASFVSALSVVALSCTKETKGKNPEIKSAAKIESALRPSNSADAAGVPGLPDTDVKLDGLRREMRENDEFLKALIEKGDRENRAYTDQKFEELSKRIDDLSKRVDALQKQVDAQKKEYDKGLLDLKSLLDQETAARIAGDNALADELRPRISALEGQMNAAMIKMEDHQRQLNEQKKLLDQQIANLEAEVQARKLGDDNLTKLLADEAKARIAADNALDVRVTTLDAKVDTLSAHVNNEITRLDAKDKELGGKLDEQGRRHAQELAAMGTKMDQGFAQGKADLDATRDTLRKEISDTAQALENKLSGELSRAEARLLKNDADLRAELTAKIDSDLNAQRTEMGEQLRLLKRELEQKIAQESAQRMLSDDDIKKQLAFEIEALRKDIAESTLNSVKAELQSALDKATARLTLAETNITAVRTEMLGEILATKTQLLAEITKTENRLMMSNEELKTELRRELTADIAGVREDLRQTATLLRQEIGESAAETKAVLRLEAQNALSSLENRLSMKDDQLRAEMTGLINSNIAAVRAEIVSQKTFLVGEIARANSNTLATLRAELSDVEMLLRKDNVALKDEMLTRLAGDIGSVRADLRTSAAQLGQDIFQATSNLRADLMTKMAEADDSLRDKLQADINNKFDRLSLDLVSFKQYADTNFATKADLNGVRLLVNGLENMTKILNRKIDSNDQAINARLTTELRQAKDQLRAEIGSVQADVDSVRNALNNHINAYKVKIQELTQAAVREALALRDEMAQQQSMNEEGLKALAGRIEALTNRVAASEIYAQDVRKSLGDKIIELQNKDADLSAEVKAARDEAAKNLINAIKAEQEARGRMQDEIVSLTNEVVRVRNVANQALNLSRANEAAVKGLGQALEAAKKDFGDQIAGLRGDMEAKIGEVRAKAESMVADLGKEVQKQFAEVTTSLAELRARDAAAANDLARAVADIVKDPVKVQKFIADSRAAQDRLVSDAGNLGGAIALVEQEFMAAIDVVHGRKGVDTKAINDSFKPIATLGQCGGLSGEKPEDVGRNSSVADREWYWHLARNYIAVVLSGSRPSDAEFAKIYFGLPTLANGDSLASGIALSSIPSYALGTSGDCVTRVSDWAKKFLASRDPVPTALRKALAENVRFKEAVTKALAPRVQALSAPALEFEAVIYALLQPVMPSREAVRKLVEVGSEAHPSLRATVAQVVVERVEIQREIASRRGTADALTDLAREVALAKDQANKNNLSIAQLTQDIADLNKRIEAAELSGPRYVQKLESGLKEAFNLIAGIASRLGYEDFVRLAKVEAGKLGGTIDPRFLFPIQCRATSHFYNFANEGQPLQRCDTGVDSGNGVIHDNGQCRTITRTHTAIQTNVNTHTHQYNISNYRGVFVVNGRCGPWGGSWCGPGYWTSEYLGTQTSTQQSQQVSTSAQTRAWEQHAYVGVLRAPILPPTDALAKEILRRPSGSPFPADRKTMFGIRLFGNAWKWRLTNMKNQSVDVDANEFKVREAASGLVYELPASLFLARDDGFAGFTETVRVQALDARGVPAGRECVHSMNGGSSATTSRTVAQTSSYSWGGTLNMWHAPRHHIYYSPMVLDLSNEGKVSTVDPVTSKALFDIDGDGRTEKVGWITPKSGLLALDLNDNGVIDNGRELFGDHTFLADGKLASNAYTALGQYDTGSKGFVDSSDKVFKKLRVWVDGNGDGVSQKNELKSLAHMGITRIGTKAGDVPLAEQTQHYDKAARNLVLYQGTYWGPKKCGTQGCKTFDVYFGTDASLRLISSK